MDQIKIIKYFKSKLDGFVKSSQPLSDVIPAPALWAGINYSRNPVNSTTSGCPRIAVRGRLLKSGMTVLRLFTSKSKLQFKEGEKQWTLNFHQKN
jgi:hypothetical protein